jgi:predicted outer membrane repeat protein
VYVCILRTTLSTSIFLTIQCLFTLCLYLCTLYCYVQCLFANNIADAAGGAVTVDTTAAISIQQVVFRGNAAAAAGAVDVLGYASIDDCAFEKNTAGTVAGALRGVASSLDESQANIVVKGSTFAANSAKQRGGAVYMSVTTAAATAATANTTAPAFTATDVST